jgi:hypothetical protein
MHPDRLNAVLECPWEAIEFERWLVSQPTAQDYLFADEVPRFEPRPEDVLVGAPGLEVVGDGAGCKLRLGAAVLEVPGVSKPRVLRLLEWISSGRSLIEVEAAAAADASALTTLLRVAFGRVLFAPEAVSALERRVPSVEIVRFPSAPYSIVRNYWQNCVAVREYLVQHLERVLSEARVDALIAFLRQLHVLMLLGEEARSFYAPASPIGRKGATPGALLQSTPRVVVGTSERFLLEGPRVRAALLGGERYCRALYAAYDSADAADELGELHDAGANWGSVLNLRARGDARAEAWFLPPRPLVAQHWHALLEALRSADALASRMTSEPDSGAREALLPTLFAALAAFHQRFVRLHPFRAANQSLAMGILNYELARVLGAGIPHLTLDHHALRLEPAAYARLFANAAHAYSVPEGAPSVRLTELRARAQAAFAFIRGVDGASAEGVRARAASDPAARFALFPSLT